MLSERSGRARVLARREWICAVTSPNGFVGIVLGSVTNPAAARRLPDGDPTSPNGLEENAIQRKAMSDRQRSLPAPSANLNSSLLQQRDLKPDLTVLLFASSAIAILPG
jgi:hypothetical protein